MASDASDAAVTIDEAAQPRRHLSRLNPSTAGGRNWKRRDASAILKEFNAQQSHQRTFHARLFLRWLRAEVSAARGSGR